MSLKDKLSAVGVENPALEARWILEDIPNLSEDQMNDIAARRGRGEPLSRILGTREFYGRRFALNEFTLDPRADSETLIEAVLNYKGAKNSILDLGAGTGCLIITLLSELSRARGVAVDISKDALVVVRTNAIAHNVQDRLVCLESNWFDSVSGLFDIIISNPPYIKSDVIPNLEESVKNFDPILALDGGMSGIEPYKILLSNAKKFLVSGGQMFLEIGFDQAEEVMRLGEDAGATLIHLHHDLGGNPRVLEITF